eukprot:Pgem_evm1s18616
MFVDPTDENASENSSDYSSVGTGDTKSTSQSGSANSRASHVSSLSKESRYTGKLSTDDSNRESRFNSPVGEDKDQNNNENKDNNESDSKSGNARTLPGSKEGSLKTIVSSSITNATAKEYNETLDNKVSKPSTVNKIAENNTENENQGDEVSKANSKKTKKEKMSFFKKLLGKSHKSEKKQQKGQKQNSSAKQPDNVPADQLEADMSQPVTIDNLKRIRSNSLNVNMSRSVGNIHQLAKDKDKDKDKEQSMPRSNSFLAPTNSSFLAPERRNSNASGSHKSGGSHKSEMTRSKSGHSLVGMTRSKSGASLGGMTRSHSNSSLKSNKSGSLMNRMHSNKSMENVHNTQLKKSTSKSQLNKQKRKFKLLMAGDSNVGKSALVQRLMHSVYEEEYKPTNFEEIHHKKLMLNNLIYELEIVDTNVDALESANDHIIAADAILLVFAIDNKKSFEKLQELCQRIQFVARDTPYIIVGSKGDRDEGNQRQVSGKTARQYARSLNKTYAEVSARKPRSTELFYTILRLLTEEQKKQVNHQENLDDNPDGPLMTADFLFESQNLSQYRLSKALNA